MRCGRGALEVADSLICPQCEQDIWDEQQASEAEAAWIAYRDGLAYARRLEDEVYAGIEDER